MHISENEINKYNKYIFILIIWLVKKNYALCRIFAFGNADSKIKEFRNYLDS